MTSERRAARLVLQDGASFSGYCFGAEKPVTGEVVFNTGMVGYPESLTDPSYHGQILALTFPLIGNHGVPDAALSEGLSRHFESERVQVLGLVVTDYSQEYSHWSAVKSLSDWMKEHDVPGITGIDTRELTKRLRERGTLPGKIIYDKDELEFENPSERNLVKEVSIEAPIEYKRGEQHVILVDCGVKANIIRAFTQRNITVSRRPWDYDFSEEKANGIVISNGPGDPKMCAETIANVRKVLSRNIPVLGICLGSQLLALAAGANTYKLKYGHRSQNQPCVETGSRRCYITSQNHGYAVDADTLPEDWREWFYNDNDRTNEGIIHISKPFFGTQFHPEASPGPDDSEFLFDMFVRAMR
ncbi:MAG: glutamine-hydrolyzing carbamoyl-phosphate synthase small subunit [Candidatus Coatesbacteria bacterium]|nr:glutamine-hydrolyzing carbamoyl-phosphate synthase small subunit [Candidatus Coatesbacteria bacterium]